MSKPTLPADLQLTLEAFRCAIGEYAQALPQPIAAVVDCLESHINDLDFISECDQEFQALYDAARMSIYKRWASGRSAVH